jgi:hypothetical protein
MSVQKKNGEEIYKGIKFTYSAYGENGTYGGNATITLHYGSYTETPMITLDTDYQTLGEAEAAIIRSAMNWIDNYLS